MKKNGKKRGPKPREENVNTVALGVNIERELKAEVEAFARADRRTIRAVTEAALRQFLANGRA